LVRNAPELRTLQKRDIAFELHPGEIQDLQRRRDWDLKRAIDIGAAAVLLTIALPVLLLVTLCAAASIGRPVLFWQQRPGLGGHPFRLYKFRTLGTAFGTDGRRLSDAERMGGVGAFLRGTRLDELPQLFNILRGDMSFIGPRPLLPRDQDPAYRARLLVRPGLTGWAQVVGGRAISAEDKAALDVWYVRNARLSLDLKIAVKTIPIILFGETISRALIEKAWTELREAGVLHKDFVAPALTDKSAAECLKAS
jgi:lipopolysaccharide/colanic/teichoic acid biosynthesis glycosyltransferase